jgi:hypothetical protein
MSSESSENEHISHRESVARLFRDQRKQDRQRQKDKAFWHRSKKIYRSIAPAFQISPAEVSRVWTDHIDDDYEAVFCETYGLDGFSIYPRVLLRNTVMKWILGTDNILESELWSFLRKRHKEDPKIIFQTKPTDVWVLMGADVSHTATLNPRILIPSSGSATDVVILSLNVFLKEYSYG